MRNRRIEGIRDIHRIAREAFAQHEIAELAEDRVLCMHPRSSSFGFEVVRLRWNSVIVHGDIEAVTFQGGDGGGLLDRLAWLAGSDCEYLQGKARRAGGHRYEVFDADALADDLAEWLDEVRAHWTPDAEDAGEVDAERVEGVTELMAELRAGEVGEFEAQTRVYELGLGWEEYRGYVLEPSLLWAHEAARVAFRLMRPHDALARFTEVPSAAALRVYNAVVRAQRGVTVERLRYAERSMAQDCRRMEAIRAR